MVDGTPGVQKDSRPATLFDADRRTEADAGPSAAPPVEAPLLPGEPTVRVKMTVAYLGRGYHGFAVQPGVPTVGGVLTDALSRTLGHPVELTCAGRTDSGVHAWGQVVSFDAAAERFETAQLQRSLNRMLAPEVVVRSVEPAPPGFDARRDASSRRYRYTVLNRPVPDPFLAATSWHVEDPVDRAALRLSCDAIIGEHDFAAFCRAPRRPARPASTVRTVLDARWKDLGEGVLRFEVEASAFCHQMVRSLVGTMVDMATGRKRPGDMAAILRGRDRSAAGRIAPPHGLCLWDVAYEGRSSG